MVDAFSFDKFGAVYLHSRVLYWKPRVRIVRSLVLDGKKSTTLLTYEETSQLQVEDMHGFDVILRLKEVRKVVWASRAPILAYSTVSRIWMWLGSFLGRHVLSFGRAGEIRNALVFGWGSPHGDVQLPDLVIACSVEWLFRGWPAANAAVVARSYLRVLDPHSHHSWSMTESELCEQSAYTRTVLKRVVYHPSCGRLCRSSRY